MKAIVLGGAGDMGSAAVRDLAADPELELLTIADANEEAAETLAAEIGGPVRARRLDATVPEALTAAIAGHDVAAGAIGPFYLWERRLADAAIAARVPYVSLCDDYDGTKAVLGLDDDARSAGVTVLTGLGWTPGLSNVLARKAADELDGVSSIRVAWGGSASDSVGFAVILHTIHIFSGRVPSFREGREIEVEAGSGRERVRFPAPLGEIDVYNVGHPEPVTLPRFIPGLTEVTLKGGLAEAPLNHLAIALAKLHLTDSPRKKQLLGKAIKAAMPVLARMGPPAEPCSGIRVDVSGTIGGEPAEVSYGAAGHMAALTGIPLAVGARMLARGEIAEPGVIAPEACVEPNAFIGELSDRGISVYEMARDMPVAEASTAFAA